MIFVIHEHFASHHHFDLRIEIDGILKSWAIPKDIPLKVGERKLAIQVDDHPLSYSNFEGNIPEGSYGAGIVKIWDKGKCKILEKNDKKIEIEFEGEKIKGKYILIFFKKEKNKNLFLFFKKNENYKKT